MTHYATSQKSEISLNATQNQKKHTNNKNQQFLSQLSFIDAPYEILFSSYYKVQY